MRTPLDAEGLRVIIRTWKGLFRVGLLQLGRVVGLRAHWSSICAEEILRGRRGLGDVSAGLSLLERCWLQSGRHPQRQLRLPGTPI
jgi:hypothetical protein